MFSPLAGVIVAFISGNDMVEENKKLEKKGIIKKCPDCAEFVKKEAKTCRYCGSEFHLV